MTKRGVASCDAASRDATDVKAKAAAPTGASSPSKPCPRPTAGSPRPQVPSGRGLEETPTPAVGIQAQMPPGVSAEALELALPVLPVGAEAQNYSEDKTVTLMRGIVAYNKHHVRRVMKEDSRWFKGWQDVPVHEHQPLSIRKPDSKDDLLTYVSPWKQAEAVISFKGTGTYKGGGNVFWLNPFVDESHRKLCAIAGDPPLYSACLDAAEKYALRKIQQEGVMQGKVSAAQEARIKFPHVFTTFNWNLASYEADHFDSSLPLVCGHVALWGFHIALMKALVSGDMASVAVLVQAALCAPIEGVIVKNDETLSIISMERSDVARIQYEYLKNSFPAFARKLMVALDGVSPKTSAARLDFCTQNGIRYNGAVVYRSMLTAAQNCYERLDDRANRTLRYIERHNGASKSDLTSAFNTLNRILQVCAKEVDKVNSAMWGSVTVCDLVNHVLEYIAWALDHRKVEGNGVTIAWLEKSRGGNGCGAMKMVIAKVCLRIFVETLVQDLPDTSVAKKEFLGVLMPFSSYAVFNKTFGTEDGGASKPAADDDDNNEQMADGNAEEGDDPFTKMKEKTAGVAVKMLEFLFDLFSQGFDDSLSEFLTSAANTNQAVCQVKWEEWQQADLVEIRRTLSLHRMTVPASEGYEMPAASTRGLKRSLSVAGDAGLDDDEDANDREKEVVKERVEAWSQAQALRRKWVSASCIKADRMSKEQLDKWWAKQTTANQFQGAPGKSHRVFVLSGERWGHETGATPWADESPSTASLDMALDWILERQGPCDTLLIFDGRSSSIRAMMQQKMQKARHVSEIWIVYQPRREAGRKIVFGSRNREVGWVSFPVPKNHVPTQDRKAARWEGNDWETTTFASTFSSMAPLAWGQLPSISLADKERIIGASTPVPPSKVFDTDLGCPLCWQEVKSKDLWCALLEATNADLVVDLGAGSGITARACLTLGIPWVGLCWNQVHVHWLNNVVDRWALEEIVKKKSPLHEQDLAKLVSAHFSDVLQQIQDRDKMIVSEESSDNDDEAKD